MAEWLKASDCKSDHYVYVGSNPTLSTILRFCCGKSFGWRATLTFAPRRCKLDRHLYGFAAGGLAPLKRKARKRALCSGKTSAFQADDASSILAARSSFRSECFGATAWQASESCHAEVKRRRTLSS